MLNARFYLISDYIIFVKPCSRWLCIHVNQLIHQRLGDWSWSIVQCISLFFCCLRAYKVTTCLQHRRFQGHQWTGYLLKDIVSWSRIRVNVHRFRQRVTLWFSQHPISFTWFTLIWNGSETKQSSFQNHRLSLHQKLWSIVFAGIIISINQCYLALLLYQLINVIKRYYHIN